MVGVGLAEKESPSAQPGRFVVGELMPVVDPDMLDISKVYMCDIPRVHRSLIEPTWRGGRTETRVGIRAEKKGSAWILLQDDEAAYRMFQIFRIGKAVPILNWAGAEHIILETVTLDGFVFQSDPSFPLHFKLVQDVGYVHLCGRGTVTTPEGISHTLDYGMDDALSDIVSNDQLAREAGSEALGWLAKTPSERDKAVTALIKALQGEAMEVRRNAASSLGKLKDLRAREPLKKALEDENEWVRTVVADALEGLEVKAQT
jgi:hypothetical protein